MIDPDSSPTSLTKTLPNKSKVSLQRPSKMSCGTEARRVLGLVDVSIVTSFPLPASVDTTRTSGAELEAKEALDAASRIIKAFFGDVNDDEAFKGCSSDTLEAADMDRS